MASPWRMGGGENFLDLTGDKIIKSFSWPWKASTVSTWIHGIALWSGATSSALCSCFRMHSFCALYGVMIPRDGGGR